MLVQPFRRCVDGGIVEKVSLSSLWISVFGIAVLLAQQPVSTQLPPSPEQSVIRTWIFPALSYGANRWSTIKLVNRSEVTKAVRVEVYGPNGESLPMSSTVRLTSKEGTEIRIAPESNAVRELCWARVSEIFDGGPSGIGADAAVEILRGNQIESYTRDPADVRRMGMWAIRSEDLRDKNLYILNMDAEPTIISFCTDNGAVLRTCQDRRRGISRYSLRPRQALIVNPSTGTYRYFFVEVPGGRDMTMISLTAGPGAIRVFSSDSMIKFGEPER